MGFTEQQQFERLAGEVKRLRQENAELRKALGAVWTAVGALTAGFERRGRVLGSALDGRLTTLAPDAEERERLGRRLVGADVVDRCRAALQEAGVRIEIGG